MSKNRSKKGTKDDVPVSIDGLKKHYFKKLYTWFLKQRKATKVILIFLIVIIAFCLARTDILGKKLYTSSKLLCPISIPGIDVEPIIPLSLDYEIENTTGKRVGKSGDKCFTGDNICISFKAGVDCWISVIGVDSKSAYPLFKKQFEPEKIYGDKSYQISFSLDSTNGTEVYYVIAGNTKFNYKKEVEPQIKFIREENSKGPSLSIFELNLEKNLSYQYFYFTHLTK